MSTKNDLQGVGPRTMPSGNRNYAEVTSGHGNRISKNVGKGHGNTPRSGTANKLGSNRGMK